MNCNKCGTPILPGENTCRFCGATDDFSVRVPAEPKKEIIGFDIYDDIQVVDFTLGEDEVSIIPSTDSSLTNNSQTMPVKDVRDFLNKKVEETNEPVKIIEEPVIIEPVAEEVVEIIEPINETVEQQTPIVNAVIEEPTTARIPVEEVKRIIEEESSHNNENEIIDEPVSQNVTEKNNETTEIIEDNQIIENDQNKEIIETTKNEIVDEVKEEKEEPKSSKTEDSKSSKKGTVASIILSILLIASIVLNCFLLMGRADKVEEKEVDVSKTSLATVFDNYEMHFPNNWDTNSSYDSYLLVYDNSRSWGASISFSENIDYSLTKDNINKITEKLGLNNYLFTSDYSKTVNNKELYVFKGKYYSYATYVIVTKIDDKNVAVADLKFTGEVEEDVLEGMFNSLTTIASKDMTSLLENNFEFNNITNLIEEVIPNTQE